MQNNVLNYIESIAYILLFRHLLYFLSCNSKFSFLNNGRNDKYMHMQVMCYVKCWQEIPCTEENSALKYAKLTK